MTYEERKREASRLLVDFLGDYATPRGLDDGQQAGRISNVADAFARRMPTDGNYAEKVEKVLMKIRDTHLSNSWPPQAAFVMAMPTMEYRGVAPKTYKTDDADRIPRMMAQGLAVPESEVWKNVNVSRDVLDKYRNASVQNWLGLYGPETAHYMREKYGAVVNQFFKEAAQ
jgi:hypothetical protein